MLIACEAGDRNGLLVNSDHLAVELVDASRRSDGSETGEIAITDLHNLGMPFIRYVNGDVATRKGPWHSVGPHGLPRLQRTERSEERRLGTGGVRTFRSRWAPYP